MVMGIPCRVRRHDALRFAAPISAIFVILFLISDHVQVRASLDAQGLVDLVRRRILRTRTSSRHTAHQAPSPSPFPPPSSSPHSISPSSSPSPSPSVSTTTLKPSLPPSTEGRIESAAVPSALRNYSSISPAISASSFTSDKSKNRSAFIVGISALSAAIIVSVALIIFCKTKRSAAAVKPWITGLSGQLQKAFLTGVPKLKKSELESACEDFCNVIGASSLGAVFKGTLSNGVEIAVVSIPVESRKEWSKGLEHSFRKKIDTLSKINHKNFVNLIGFCEETHPFTRMMVFEYAPNGTLFEHLHVEEAERLDWDMRLRVAMGIAYCLEHMHQLKPPIAHDNLNSSVVNLTEDYAAKITDFSFKKEMAPGDVVALDSLRPKSTATEDNVHSFGAILFEMMTGELPSADDHSVIEWSADYSKGRRPLSHIVDPTLKYFSEDQLESIADLIAACVDTDPAHRPTMGSVSSRLREITEIELKQAVPKLSPLWWAELEILSTEAT